MSGFQLISSTPVFKSEKVQVNRERIKLPNESVVEWDLMVYPDFYEAVTIEKDYVLMTKEWRQGPHDYLTQFTKARATHETEEGNLQELKKELQEEMGITGGKFEKILHFAQGVRLAGFCSVYLLTDFQTGKPNRGKNEIQEIVRLPIKGLYEELSAHHIVMPETLLIAKLLEEKLK